MGIKYSNRKIPQDMDVDTVATKVKSFIDYGNTRGLQEIQQVVHLPCGTWHLVEGIADQQSQLVSILAGGRNSNRSRPVVVKVRQLVSEPLHVLWLQAGGILYNVVGGGVDRSLCHRLGNQEEVVPFRLGDNIVYNGAAVNIARLAVHGKELGVDPLADDHVGELHTFQSLHLEALLDGGNLVVQYIRDLTITNTISVHDHPLRRLPIDLDVLPQSLGDGWHHVVSHLAHPVVNVSRRDKPCEVLVEGGHQRACRIVLVQGVVVGVVAQYHGVLHGDVDSPGLTPHLTVHLHHHLHTADVLHGGVVLASLGGNDDHHQPWL